MQVRGQHAQLVPVAPRSGELEGQAPKAGARRLQASAATSVLGSGTFSLQSPWDGGVLAFLRMVTCSENCSVTG